MRAVLNSAYHAGWLDEGVLVTINGGGCKVFIVHLLFLNFKRFEKPVLIILSR